MVFSILVILLVGVVAFFHYVQGFFSATISAFIAAIAAIMAVSYHETVVSLLLKGKMADYAHGMVLCMIFAVVYIVLRVIFDAAIPGNVRTPSVVDKVGAGVMGLVAGTFTVGIFAIAAQTIPWDAGMSLLGYTRYELTSTRKVTLPSSVGRQDQDADINNEMVANTMEPDKQTGLWLPVDDWVLDTVYHVTNGGSLAGDRPLASVHPDYLQELFGERIGIQTGGRRVALALNGNDPVDVSAVFTAADLPAKDGGLKKLRPLTDKYQPPFLQNGQVKLSGDQRILIVRVKVNSSATDDEDQYFRFSPGSIHLVCPTGEGTYTDAYPIGTLESGQTVVLNRVDDFLFVKADDSFDAVFLVNSSVITPDNKIKEGVLISVKRFGLVDLSGKTVETKIKPDPGVKVLRHPLLAKELPAAPAAQSTPAATPQANNPPASNVPAPAISTPATPEAPAAPAVPQPTADRPIAQDISGSIGNSLASSIQLGTTANDQDAKEAPVPGGGKMTLVGGQIGSATVDPTVSISDLTQGVQQSGQLIEPQDRKMVQVQVQPYTPGWDMLADLSSVAVVDSNGNKYPPNGFYALVKGADGKSLLLRYDYMHGGFTVPTPSNPPDGGVYFIFLIPHDTELKSLTIGGKTQKTNRKHAHENAPWNVVPRGSILNSMLESINSSRFSVHRLNAIVLFG
jgi:hypothetical protein